MNCSECKVEMKSVLVPVMETPLLKWHDKDEMMYLHHDGCFYYEGEEPVLAKIEGFQCLNCKELCVASRDNLMTKLAQNS